MINAPNLVTLSRIALTVVVVLNILHGQWRLAFWMSILAGVTDLIDGFLARLLKMSSRTGAYLDPIADKLLLTSIYIALGFANGLPWWMVALVLGRDVFILAMAAWGYFFTPVREFPPSIWGKLSTFTQILAALAVMNHEGGSHISSQPFLWIMVVATAISGIHYGWRGLSKLRGLKMANAIW